MWKINKLSICYYKLRITASGLSLPLMGNAWEDVHT